MPYDERLAARIRELLEGEPALTEKRMFGGQAFLVGGNLAVAASGRGLMVRADPDEGERLVATTPARPMEMRGRQLRGWLRVATEEVATKQALRRWVSLGVGYARSLPPKG